MKFKLQPGTLERIELSPQLWRHLALAATAIEKATASAAPTDLLLTTSPAGVDAHGPVAQVGARHPGATAIEFGSVNNAPYAPFRQGVRRVGMRLRDRGRH